MKNAKKLGCAGIYELAEKGGASALIKIVKESPHHADVKFTIRALGEMKSQEAVEPIIYSLLNQYLSVRSAAVWALGEIANTKTVKPLVLMLRNNDEEISLRGEILEALGKINDPRATEAIINVFCNGSHEISEKAATVLKKMGATKPLISALKDANPEVKLNIVKIMGETGDKAVSQILMAILKNPEELSVIREEVAKALAKMKEGVDLEFILQFVKESIPPEDEKYKLRCCLITLLGETGDFKATETLIRLLLNRNNELRIRYQAAHALGRMGDNSAIDSLVSVLENPQDIDIKPAVAAALFALDETKTAQPLVTYLKSKPDFMNDYKLLSPDDL